MSPIIVLGLGAMGSASLLELARRGIPAIGVDRFAPPHTQGSSHGLSRLIRLCYFEHPDYVPLLRHAYDGWHELQLQARTPLLKITGGLYIGAPEDPFVAGSLASARAHALEHELLAAPALRARFPQFLVRDQEVGFFEPTTGVLFPERAIAANLDLAARLGATVLTNHPVLDWSAGGGAVTLHTAHSRIIGSSLILAPGPWLPSLFPGLAPRLSITRQVLVWHQPLDPRPLFSPAMPAWSVSDSLGSGAAHYGFPMFPPPLAQDPPGGPGFKFALHHPGPSCDPDSVDREPDPRELHALTEFLAQRIPAAAGPLLSHRVCMYTSTPDQDFLIDFHPHHENVLVLSACSGHGFKFAPVLARAAVDLVTRRQTPLPIGFLRYRPSLRS